MLHSTVSRPTPTVITNAHFDHISFSEKPRRFPGEATDDLPPSSPPPSDGEDESELAGTSSHFDLYLNTHHTSTAQSQMPASYKITIENLRRVRETSKRALLGVETDLDYFEKSQKLTNVLTTTIKIFEEKIAQWELYHKNAEREKGRLERRVRNIKGLWKTYQETMDTLNNTQDNLEDVQCQFNKLSREFDLERDELQAQLDSLTHQNNLLMSKNEELQEDVIDTERNLDRYRQYEEG
ncbi:hypothetical protein PQX77_019146 [Marasmius sp. AFHP31]|nr:hypothetical protein PQX77_019146 [Marasmius sp. AFHP31]